MECNINSFNSKVINCVPIGAPIESTETPEKWDSPLFATCRALSKVSGREIPELRADFHREIIYKYLWISSYGVPKEWGGRSPFKKKQANLKIKWGQTPAFYFVGAFYSLRCPTHQVKWQR